MIPKKNPFLPTQLALGLGLHYPVEPPKGNNFRSGVGSVKDYDGQHVGRLRLRAGRRERGAEVGKDATSNKSLGHFFSMLSI